MERAKVGLLALGLMVIASPLWGEVTPQFNRPAPSIYVSSYPVASGGGGSISVVQSTSNAVSGSTITVRLQSASTSGNLLVLVATCYENASNPTINAPTDNSINTWVQATTQAASNGFHGVGIWYSQNITGRVNHDISITNAVGDYISLAVAEYSGAATSGVLDVIARETGTNQTPTTHDFTMANSNSIIVAGVSEDTASGTTITAGSNFTIRRKHDGVDSNSYQPIALEDRGIGGGLTPGTTNATFSLDNSENWAIASAVFNAQ